jgi:hypothetical protein
VYHSSRKFKLEEKMNRPVLAALFLLTLTAGCTQAVQEDQENREVQPQVEASERFSGNCFSIVFPKDWRVEEFEDGTVVAHDSLLGTEEVQEKATLAEYYAKSRTGLSDLPGYTEVETGGAIIAGAEARWIIYTQKGLNGQLKALLYCFVAGNSAFSITCTAELDQFDNYKNTFETIAKSFVVEQQ